MPGVHGLRSWLILLIILLSSIRVSSEETTIEPTKNSISEYDKRQIDCLAKNMYFEARGESKKGQIAVANVTINRTKHKSFPSSICGVVRQKNQFEWVNGKEPKVTDLETFFEIRQLAKEIYFSESFKDVTKGSLYFHQNRDYRPEWTQGLNKTVSIGNHTFYK